MPGETPVRYPKPNPDFGVVAEATRRSMVGNRGKNTSLETDFRRALREQGLLGYRIHARRIPGKPDVSWAGRKVAVFLHGCFWHGCPHCGRYRLPKHNREYWQAKIETNRDRHARVESELTALGFRVLVFWECQIKEDVAACVGHVREALAQSSA